MRFGKATILFTCFLHGAFASASDRMSPVHMQRYCMGTMFDILAYHTAPADAERAIGKAMAEVLRLDQVMSHFKVDSDLSRLVRTGRGGFVRVEPSLYEVIERSVEFSRMSDGRFDVTVAPLLRVWRAASSEDRWPAGSEISAALRCVGFEKIEMQAPDRIRLGSDCLELDLGGIGKGFAVDRAVSVLRSAGIRHAVVNAGGSSIAAIGSPPGQSGWPVSVGLGSASRTLLLQDGSISTSQQHPAGRAAARRQPGDIVNASTGEPASGGMSVSVVAPSATTSDALSTTLVILSKEEGSRMLSRLSGVSALWVSPDGDVQTMFRESLLRFARAR